MIARATPASDATKGRHTTCVSKGVNFAANAEHAMTILLGSSGLPCLLLFSDLRASCSLLVVHSGSRERPTRNAAEPKYDDRLRLIALSADRQSTADPGAARHLLGTTRGTTTVLF
jgi:hypothetical protein